MSDKGKLKKFLIKAFCPAKVPIIIPKNTEIKNEKIVLKKVNKKLFQKALEVIKTKTCLKTSSGGGKIREAFIFFAIKNHNKKKVITESKTGIIFLIIEFFIRQFTAYRRRVVL